MALKRKITKEAYEKLSDDLKAEYGEKDGSYILDVEGDEDTGALKRAKDRETQGRKDAEKKLKDAQEELNALGDSDAKKRGDIETLEKSWKTKNEELESGFKTQLAGKDSFITKTLIDNVALKMASNISTSPGLILPHIKARLAADLEGDSPITKVLDADGKPSALTIEDLEKEFVANKDYAAIIIASKASGSSTSNDGKNSSTNGGANNGDQKPLSELSPKELGEHLRESKQRQE